MLKVCAETQTALMEIMKRVNTVLTSASAAFYFKNVKENVLFCYLVVENMN